MTKLAILALVLIAACGDDEPGAGQARPNAPAGAAAAKKKAAGSKNKLQPRMHVEDKIDCPVPDAPTGHPACSPMDAPDSSTSMLPDCDPGTYCLQVANAWSCEPCPERDSIRHEFRDRDFVADQSRDPFDQSGVIVKPGLGQGNGSKPEPHLSCKRADQFVATNYSYQDLRLVGIIAQGTQRKVLMMDTANMGHSIKRGDCVGKEKAVVKDIGAGYVTFVVDEDPDTRRPATETSVQLHPGGLDVEPPPTSQPNPTPIAPSPTPAPMAPVIR